MRAVADPLDVEKRLEAVDNNRLVALSTWASRPCHGVQRRAAGGIELLVHQDPFR